MSAGCDRDLHDAVRYIFVTSAHDPQSLRGQFYDPQTFTLGNLFGCTSLSVLSYIGFDGIALSLKSLKNPRRNIMLATV